MSNERGSEHQELSTADHGAPAAELLASDHTATPHGPTRASSRTKRASTAAVTATLLQPTTSQRLKQTWDSFAHSAATTRTLTALRSAAISSGHWLATHTSASPRLPKQWRHPAISYIAAAVLEVLAALLAVVLTHVNPGLTVRNLLPFLVVVLVTFVFGTGPSILASVLGALLLKYLLLPPYFSWTWTGTNAASTLLFLLLGLAFSYGASRVDNARRTAEALASELQATFDAMTDGVVVYDAQGHITHVNDAGHALFGSAATMGQALTSLSEHAPVEVIRDELGQPFPPERQPVTRLLRGEILSGSDEVEALATRNDGTDEVMLSVGGAPIRGRNGHITGAVLVARDVTPRRRLERRTQEALQALLEMAQVLVAGEAEIEAEIEATEPTSVPLQIVARRMADLTRNVLGCSRVAITAVDPLTESMRPLAVAGLTSEQETHMWATQLPDVHLSNALAPTQIAQMRAGETLTADLGEENLNSEKNPYHARAVLLAPCLIGEQLVGLLTVDYASAPHAYTTNEIALASAVAKFLALVIERERLVRDRAQAQANELALREANRRMDEFLSIASHELKTPLTAISTNVQLLDRQLKRIPPQGADVEATERLAQAVRTLLPGMSRGNIRLNRLVEDLLDVSRIREGKLDFRPDQYDLAAIVREAVDDQRQQQPDRTINLEIATSGPVPVAIDADRIEQVIANYLTNALKYSQEDRPVDVLLAVEDSRARVSVRDQGAGIPAAELSRIWEMFHRVEGIKVQSGSGVGLGLGLHISHTIIERHGGQVGVESVPGQGSTFWFTLPTESNEM